MMNRLLDLAMILLLIGGTNFFEASNFDADELRRIGIGGGPLMMYMMWRDKQQPKE